MLHTRPWRIVLAGAALYVAAGCKGPSPYYDMATGEDLAADDLTAAADLAGGADLLSTNDLRQDQDLREDQDLGVPDLSMPDLRMTPPDLFTPDLRSPPDLFTPDLRSPPDLFTPDLSAPPDMATPPDMGTCTGSASCGGQICCADITVGPGTPPMCSFGGVAVACKATCNGSVGLTCNMTARVRLCDAPADCASDPGGYKHCCKLALGAFGGNVCINDLLKAVLMPTCL